MPGAEQAGKKVSQLRGETLVVPPSPAGRRKRGNSTPPVPLNHSAPVGLGRELSNDSLSLASGLRFAIFDKLHEDRLKQAFYYSAANAILIILSAAGIALWFVFQEFIEPLFWAVLCGALLHPLKTKWVSGIDRYLVKMTNRKIPLVLGVSILILSIPGMIFRFLTRTPTRTALVGTVTTINIMIDFLGWNKILAFFVTSSKLLFAGATWLINNLISSGAHVNEFTAHIGASIVTTVIILYFGIIFMETNEMVNVKYSSIAKWMFWLFFAAKAYPYIVYNWITVLTVAGFILCTFLGLRQKIHQKKLSGSYESIPVLKIQEMSSLSTELNTILFIFCVMLFANIVQVVVFLLAIGSFYWVALGIKYLVLRVFRYKTFSEHIAPRPILFVYECFEKGDQILVQWIRKQLNLVVSVLIIFLLVAGLVIVVVFFSVHLYKENTQLAEDIWETRTVILPKLDYIKQYMNKTTEYDFDELYNTTSTLIITHGQDWIQHRISDITGSEVSVTDLQQKIGEFWGDTSGALSNMEWNVPTNIAMDLIRSGDAASFWKAYGSNVSMVVETIWSQLILNIRLVWWVVMKGWGLFNFLFSLLLFLTALFYLIGTSEDKTYKPVSWLLFFFPEESFREEAGDLINESVSQVFKIAFKLSIFHGLWCWSTLTVFGCQMVYLPTLLSMLMALVPLLPTYFDCIPGVLELWLVWKRPFSAIAMFVLHLAASWWVDPLVYSEIQSSHHYVTGLSVVGGLYFFGVQGVLIGPMLVCALLVFRKIIMHMAEKSGKSDS